MGDSFQMVHGNRLGRRKRGVVKHEEDQERGKSLGRPPRQYSVHEGEMPGTRGECPASDVRPFRMPQKRIGDRSAWAWVVRVREADGRGLT